MTDLARYRTDILNDMLRLEIFCSDLVDELGSRQKAEKWLEEKMIPAFEGAIEETYPEEN